MKVSGQSIDGAIAELEEKARLIQDAIAEMRQWRAVLAEEIAKRKNVVMAEDKEQKGSVREARVSRNEKGRETQYQRKEEPFLGAVNNKEDDPPLVKGIVRVKNQDPSTSPQCCSFCYNKCHTGYACPIAEAALTIVDEQLIETGAKEQVFLGLAVEAGVGSLPDVTPLMGAGEEEPETEKQQVVSPQGGKKRERQREVLPSSSTAAASAKGKLDNNDTGHKNTPIEELSRKQTKREQEEEQEEEQEINLETLPGIPSKRHRRGLMSYRQACEVCGLVGMDTLEKLRAHIKTHVKNPSRTCPVPTCKQVLKSNAGLLRHILVGHHRMDRSSGEQVSVPLVPDVNFSVPPGLTLECFGCKRGFTNADELDGHIRKHLAKVYPQECNMMVGSNSTACRYQAATQDEMARHVILFHYKLEGECSVCGKRGEGHECSIGSEDVVGKRVAVRWLRDNDIAWYSGTVKLYLPETDSFEIMYDDGTRVNESLSTRYWRLQAPVLD